MRKFVVIGLLLGFVVVGILSIRNADDTSDTASVQHVKGEGANTKEKQRSIIPVRDPSQFKGRNDWNFLEEEDEHIIGLSIHNTGSGFVTDKLVERLVLSKDEVEGINAAISTALSQIHTLEVSNITFVMENANESIAVLEPFPGAGEVVRDEFNEEIEKWLDEDRKQRFDVVAKKFVAVMLGDFGANRRVLRVVREYFDVNPNVASYTISLNVVSEKFKGTSPDFSDPGFFTMTANPWLSYGEGVRFQENEDIPKVFEHLFKEYQKADESRP